MGTLFTEIYETNEILKNDNRLSIKPTNLIYKLYYTYLKYSMGLFYRYSYQNLMNHIPFSQTEYKFITNGIDNEFLLQSPTTPPDGCKFYIGKTISESVAYTEITSDKYSYNSNTNVLTIDGDVIGVNNIIYVSAYIIGEFFDVVDFDAQNILNEGMLIPYLKEQQNRNSLMTFMVSGAGQDVKSQANHISAIHTTVKDQEERVKQLIVQYSYGATPNNLNGLGGHS